MIESLKFRVQGFRSPKLASMRFRLEPLRPHSCISLRLKDLLGPVARVKKKKREVSGPLPWRRRLRGLLLY